MDAPLLSSVSTDESRDSLVGEPVHQSLDWFEKVAAAQSPPDLPYVTGLEGQEDSPFDCLGINFDLNIPDDILVTAPHVPSRADTLAPLATLYPAPTEVVDGSIVGANPHCSPRTSDDEPFRRNDPAPVDAKQVPMQKLSILDYELLTTLNKLEQGPPQVTMEMLVDADANSSSGSALEEILGRTMEFIEVLKLLADSCLRSSSTSSVDTSHGLLHDSDGASRRSSCSSTYSEYDSNSESDNHGINSKDGSRTPPASAQLTRDELDTPALLLVLTAYVRVLRLHVIMFVHFYEYLRDISEKKPPHLQPGLGLGGSLGNFPIRMSAVINSKSQILNHETEPGNMQALVLIQVATSLFEKIDAILGLPSDFQINRRRRQTSGLLSAPGPLALAKIVLEQEGHGSPMNGKGGIQALHKHVAKAKKLLKERIAP